MPRVFTDRGLGILLAVGSAIALLASFQLSLDKIRLLENPDYDPACNFSILMSCKSVINSEQGAAFGFPNPFIGLIGYGIVIAIGVAAASGVRFPRWYWVGTLLGMIFAAKFIHGWPTSRSSRSASQPVVWSWAATIPCSGTRCARTVQAHRRRLGPALQQHLVPVSRTAVAGIIPGRSGTLPGGFFRESETEPAAVSRSADPYAVSPRPPTPGEQGRSPR